MDGRDLILLILGITVVTLAVFGAIVGWAVHDDNDWQQFFKQHHCEKIGYMSGDVITTFGVSANGQAAIGIGSTPSKEGWKCDDGVTYWR